MTFAENKESGMKKYECLVKRDRITEKIIRWFTSDESAFAWLELEGYQVFYIKELGNQRNMRDSAK